MLSHREIEEFRTACFEVARRIEASYAELLTCAAQVAMRVALEAAVIRLFASSMQRFEKSDTRVRIELNSIPCLPDLDTPEQEQRVAVRVAALSGHTRKTEPSRSTEFTPALSVLAHVAVDARVPLPLVEEMLRHLDRHLRPRLYQA